MEKTRPAPFPSSARFSRPGPRMFTLFETRSCPLVSVMVAGAGSAKLIVSPLLALARVARSVPAPLSAVLVTVIVAAWRFAAVTARAEKTQNAREILPMIFRRFVFIRDSPRDKATPNAARKRIDFIIPLNNSFEPQGRASHRHAVGLEDSHESVSLFGGVAFVNCLFARRQAFVFGQRLEELLDLAGWLVGVDDPGWDAAPRVLYVARNEHGFTRSEVEALLANFQLHLAVNDVNPFVLVRIHVARPSGVVDLQDTHRTTRVLSGHLAIDLSAVVGEPFVEPILSCADVEALKQFLTFHLLRSFQMADGFVDGLNQRARPRDVLFQNLPVRLESGDFLELSLAQDFLDALQFEAQLPVKEDLLEHEQLRLFVDSVAVRLGVG